MRLYLDQIPEAGFSSQTERPPAEYDLDTEEARVTGPLSLDVSALRQEDELLVRLAMGCTRQLVCARCLLTFEEPFSKEIDLAYPTAGVTFIDLTDDIRQEIVMEYPIRPLCRESCKGICYRCGQNLNEASCTCAVGAGNE